MAAKTRVDIGGHRLELTNLDKVLYPETGTTKGDVIRYYTQIAPLLIPYAEWRAVTLKRWVNGVGTTSRPESGFFQKNGADNAPAWVRGFTVQHARSTNHYPLLNDQATLVWMAQLAALEIHVPQWRFGPRGAQHHPDRLVIDLDPGEGVHLDQVVEIALIVRERLLQEGLVAFPVTSGSKGIHLYAALDGTRASQEASDFAHDLARDIEASHRNLVVSDMAKKLRGGKVLIDWSQNNAAKTTICPYSLRGRAHPMVACPRTWEELQLPDLHHLRFEEVLERASSQYVDPLSGLLGTRDAQRSLSPSRGRKMPTNVQAARDERLSTYRDKRHPDRTPEPMAGEAGRSGERPVFVIQEHHARRLHYDFRLEHDDVLVSWALPKGVPDDPKRNRLAVHTEDHPMEYADFEGAIPAGEYGAGQVSTWDRGTFDLHKWREDEVVVTLHGRESGGLGGADRTFALIRTGGRTAADDQWLMHVMVHPPLSTRIPAEPMLATPSEAAEITGPDWACEMKWDGVRVIGEVTSGSAALWSRNGKDITGTFPDIVRGLQAAVSSDLVVDGEIIALGEQGRPSFGRLQERLGVFGAEAAARAERTPAFLMLFDLLFLDGVQLRDRPYDERRDALAAAVSENSTVYVPPSYAVPIEDALRISAEHGLEGVVAKRRNSPYRPGSRSPAWRKVKHENTQDVVVVGWLPGKASELGSLVVAVPDGTDRLRYAGRVGTGFTERARTELLQTLQPLRREDVPAESVPADIRRRARGVEPRCVGEVRYTEWTHGGVLRHPSWRGLRPDMSVAEVRPPDLPAGE